MPTPPAAVADIDVEPVLDALRRLEVNADRRARQALKQFGDEVAVFAKQNHDYRDRTGKLTASIRSDEPKGTFVSGLSIDVVAGGVRGVSYASHVEFGTKPHVITAKGRALRFSVDASKGVARQVFRKRVRHPGTRPYRFMRNALAAKLPRAEQLLETAFELAAEESGL